MVPKTIKKCSVCTDKEDPENEIFTCSGCNLNVHRLCYGIQCDFDANWKCSLCKKGICKNVLCKLCLQAGEAMKPTVCGQYIHVVCGLFTDGVVFENPDTMEPINVSNVSSNKRNKMCNFCKKKSWFLLFVCESQMQKSPSYNVCTTRKLLKRTLKERWHNQISGFLHGPQTKLYRPQNFIRIRSQSIIADRKKKDDENKKKNGTQLNTQWILDATKKNNVNVAIPIRNNDEGASAIENVDASFQQNSNGKSPSNVMIVDSSEQGNSNGKRKATGDLNHTPKQKKVKKARPAKTPADKMNWKSPPTRINALNDIEGKFIMHSNTQIQIVFKYVYKYSRIDFNE